MRILFDQGTPAPLRRALKNHSVSTAHEMGWAARSNGALLRSAELEFDVLITTDRNIRNQQSLAGSRLAILILPTTSWPRIRASEALVAVAVDKLRPGDVVELSFS
jgi:predicted nuclease of predicted toxin-antitoxin system